MNNTKHNINPKKMTQQRQRSSHQAGWSGRRKLVSVGSTRSSLLVMGVMIASVMLNDSMIGTFYHHSPFQRTADILQTGTYYYQPTAVSANVGARNTCTVLAFQTMLPTYCPRPSLPVGKNRRCFVPPSSFGGFQKMKTKTMKVNPPKSPTARWWVDDGTGIVSSGPQVSSIAKMKVQRYYNTWEWKYNGRTYLINYRVEGGSISGSGGAHGNRNTVGNRNGHSILLIHGFGANLNHFRYNIPSLVHEGYTVYAMDLLGFGGSEKPKDPQSVGFCVELFAQQMIDFMASRHTNDNDLDDDDDVDVDDDVGSPEPQQQQQQRSWILAGNSIGGLCSLQVAARASKETFPFEISSLVLFNSAGGMTGFRYSDVPVPFHPLMGHVQYFVLGPIHGPLLYRVLAQKTTIQPLLQNAGIYKDPTNVDDELLSMLLDPAMDDGAQDVFLSVYSGPAGPTRESLLPHIRIPILALWGEEDGFTPYDDTVRALPSFHGSDDMILDAIPNAGHCLHDECPDIVNMKMISFLKERLGGVSVSNNNNTNVE